MPDRLAPPYTTMTRGRGAMLEQMGDLEGAKRMQTEALTRLQRRLANEEQATTSELSKLAADVQELRSNHEVRSFLTHNRQRETS